jgi:hypothetical protein
MLPRPSISSGTRPPAWVPVGCQTAGMSHPSADLFLSGLDFFDEAASPLTEAFIAWTGRKPRG